MLMTFLSRVLCHWCLFPLLAAVAFFFFQAEDGIRDDLVTGVQTCALPILVIATSVEDLHGAGNKISKESGLTEKGTVVNGVGDTPNQHDMLTGSNMEGRAKIGRASCRERV